TRRRTHGLLASLHPPVVRGRPPREGERSAVSLSSRHLRRGRRPARRGSSDAPAAAHPSRAARGRRLRRRSGDLAVETRKQGSVVFNAVLVLVGTLIII